jgi:hypothetical protein
MRALPYYYGVELHNFNPNSIVHAVIFITVCEGYLGIKPHWDLWVHLFRAEPFSLPSKVRRVRHAVQAGDCTLQLHLDRVALYIPATLTSSNKGWGGRVSGSTSATTTGSCRCSRPRRPRSKGAMEVGPASGAPDPPEVIAGGPMEASGSRSHRNRSCRDLSPLTVSTAGRPPAPSRRDDPRGLRGKLPDGLDRPL